MITKKDIRKIRRDTKNALTKDDWKKIVTQLYNLYGRDSIYYLCCDIFLTKGDKSVDSIPYVNPKYRFGIAIRHTKFGKSSNTDDETILFI